MLENIIWTPFGEDIHEGVEDDFNTTHFSILATFDFEDKEYIAIMYEDESFMIGEFKRVDNEERTYIALPIKDEDLLNELCELFEKELNKI